MVIGFQLLETVIKNCGDVVHMHVAEKDVLHEMVKIVKKKVIIFLKSVMRCLLLAYFHMAPNDLSLLCAAS